MSSSKEVSFLKFFLCQFFLSMNKTQLIQGLLLWYQWHFYYIHLWKEIILWHKSKYLLIFHTAPRWTYLAQVRNTANSIVFFICHGYLCSQHKKSGGFQSFKNQIFSSNIIRFRIYKGNLTLVSYKSWENIFDKCQQEYTQYTQYIRNMFSVWNKGTMWSF